MTAVHLIVAMTPAGVIGVGNKLPWRIPEDMAHFKALTTGKAVIMGRKTWESIPAKFRPLPDRKNIVITRDEEALGRTLIAGGSGLGSQVVTASGIEHALQRAQWAEKEPWIIGGAQIYAEALRLGVVTDMHITSVEREYALDGGEPVLFPDFDITSWRIQAFKNLADGVIYKHYRKA